MRKPWSSQRLGWCSCRRPLSALVPAFFAHDWLEPRLRLCGRVQAQAGEIVCCKLFLLVVVVKVFSSSCQVRRSIICLVRVDLRVHMLSLLSTMLRVP